MNSEKFPHDDVCRYSVVIGLIGDVAGGKSTVARRLVSLGAGWIDADRIAHRCLNLPSVRQSLVSRFGTEIQGPDGRIARPALASRVFGADAESRESLEYLQRSVHPPTRLLVIRRMRKLVRRGVRVIVIDAPLLLEAAWDFQCDEVWCVRASFRRRVSWAASRGWSEAELQARQSRQIATSHKSQRSTVTLENRADRAALLAQVDRLFQCRIRRGES